MRFHFPFLAFLAFTVFKGNHRQPGMTAFILCAPVAVMVLAWSHVAWWFFERRTDDARSAVVRWLRGWRLQI